MLALKPQPVPSDCRSYTANMSHGAFSSKHQCSTLMPQPLSISSSRPKLSLDTAQAPPPFGPHTTSLRLDTLSVTSPTSRNTFTNAWERRPPRLMKPTGLSLAINKSSCPDLPRHSQDEDDDSPHSLSGDSESSADTVSTNTSPDDRLPPYTLSYNVKSILINGPITRKRPRDTSPSGRRCLFPKRKCVKFSAHLTEDISTKTYVLTHHDLSETITLYSTTVAPSISEVVPPSKARQIAHDADEADRVRSRTTIRVTPPLAGHKRSSPESPLSEDNDDNNDEDQNEDENGLKENDEEQDHSAAYPTTPAAGRRKRLREWVWTLGPLGSSGGDVTQ